MSNHYFIGVKIPQWIAEKIVQAREETTLRKTHKSLPLKEDLHITLSFLGAVALDALEELIQSLEQIDWTPFSLMTDGLASFGNERTPRVVFVGVQYKQELHALQMEVAKVVSSVLGITDTRAYHPHITIAKKWASRASLDIENFDIEEMSFQVESFSIFQINPTKTPRYEDVHLFASRRE